MLHMLKDLEDYAIHATDGNLGLVSGFYFDDKQCNTSNWWLGHLVLVAPQWIREVSWVNSKIYVDMTQQRVKSAPLFDPAITFNRDHEEAIHLHYGRAGYWR